MLLKVELHSHTADDPRDAVPYSAWMLIDRAAALGYHALAITLHDKQLDVEPFRSFASARGVVLIPGVERTIQGKHVLLINFTARTETVTTMEDLDQLRRAQRGVVIGPHPFFPAGCCLGNAMDRYAGLIDAVEFNGMYARGANFNKAAVRWAARHGKPLVGNGDVHRLSQLGTTYTLVEAEPNPESICAAIRAGRVEVHTRPLTWIRTLTLLADLVGSSLRAASNRTRAPAHTTSKFESEG
jgi:predicted metal-dependent phosphoesterase TrpH